MGSNKPQQNYAGRIAAILAVLTVVITVINSIPPFMALRGKEPYVVYSVGRSQMLYPKDADRQAIRKLLREQSIPDAFATLSLSNRGDVIAKDVIVTLRVPGRIIAEETEPPIERKPAWVSASKEFNFEDDDSRIRYNLKNLGLLRTFNIKVSYLSESSGDAGWELFYDGKPGEFVSDLNTVPNNARAVSFIPSLKILGIGLLLSFVAYGFTRYREFFRQNPFIRAAKGISASPAWRRYKNSVVMEIAKIDRISIYSTADGSIGETDPKKFWDANFEINGRHFAVEIHVSAQEWAGIFGDASKQEAYCLRICAMANTTEPKLSYVFLAIDKDVWGEAPGANLTSIFSSLASDVRIELVSGSPEEVARRVLEILPEFAA